MLKRIGLIILYGYLLVLGPVFMYSVSSKMNNLAHSTPQILVYLEAKNALEDTNPNFLNLEFIKKAMSLTDPNFVAKLDEYQTLSFVFEILVVVEFILGIIGIGIILEWIFNS